MNKKIIWSKWVDPIGLNLDEFDPEFVDRTPEEEETKEEEKPYVDSYEEMEKLQKSHMEQMKPGKARYPKQFAVTPIGIIPITPFNNPARVFNFWVGHTNFNISKKVSSILNNIDGVEMLDVWTRYRFRISIGKCFNFPEVARSIQVAFGIGHDNGDRSPEDWCSLLSSQVIKTKLDLLKEQLNKFYKYWVIYIAPNGAFDIKGTENIEEYKSLLSIYKETQSIAGGLVISKENEPEARSNE